MAVVLDYIFPPIWSLFYFCGGALSPQTPLHVGGKPPIPPKVKDWMLQCPMASEKDIFQWIYFGPTLANGSETSCPDGDRVIPNIFYLAYWLNHKMNIKSDF